MIKRVTTSGIPAALWHDLRAGVIISEADEGDVDVAAFHNDEGGAFRLYDNDSFARRAGTFETQRADELMDRYSSSYIIGVMSEGSDLSNLIGGVGMTTLIHREKRIRDMTSPTDTASSTRQRTSGPSRVARPRKGMHPGSPGRRKAPRKGVSRKRKIHLTIETVEASVSRLLPHGIEECSVDDVCDELRRQGLSSTRQEVIRLLQRLEEEDLLLLRDAEGGNDGPLETIYRI